jgi:hypothetical protein
MDNIYLKGQVEPIILTEVSSIKIEDNIKPVSETMLLIQQKLKITMKDGKIREGFTVGKELTNLYLKELCNHSGIEFKED